MLRVRTIFSGPAGTPWLSTFYFGSVDGSQANAAAAVAATGAFWNAVDAHMALTVSWATDPEVAVLDNSGDQTASRATTPQTGTGTASGDMLPAALQGLVRWYTGQFIGGRQIRGRTFVPGLTESAAVAGVLSTAVQTAINAAAAALVAAADADLIIWSRTSSGGASVSSAATWNQFAVLRSRRD